MPAKPTPTSPAVGAFLKDQRQRLGYTLREVEELSGRGGKLIPFSTLARIEQGLLDPGLPRLQQLLRVYNVPIQAAGDLLDLEEFADEPPRTRDPQKLYDLGREGWRRGDARAAVAAFMALKRLDRDVEPLLRQKNLNALSMLAGNLGKFHFAKQVVEGLLLEGPDPSILVSVLVQAAKCWQSLGSLEVAMALLERAHGRLTAKHPPLQHAFVYHAKASILTSMKEFAAADEALSTALEAYRRAGDDNGYCMALLVRARSALESGDPRRALMTAQAGRLYAQRHKMARLRMLFSIVEGHVHLELGDVQACLARLGQALAEGVAAGDKAILFYVHYYYWQAYLKLGDGARAGAELETAKRLVASIDEVSPETTHVRSLLAERPPQRGRRRRRG